MTFNRRIAFSMVAFAAFLASCGGGKGNGKAVEGDMILGNAQATVTVIEYASPTCPHCKAWHEDVYPVLKKDYLDTGKVKFIFREFPTPPINVARAGSMVARCAGSDKFFDVLDTLFERQDAIRDNARIELETVAREAGLSKSQFEACIADPQSAARIDAIVDTAVKDYKISGTPSFIVNGKLVEDGGMVTAEGLKKVLDAALAETAPAAPAG